MNRQLSRAIIGAGGLIGLGLAFQPLYAEPGLHALALQSGELLIQAWGVIGITLASGYAIHRIKAWASERPVMPTPSQMFAVAQSYGPALAGEVAVAQAAERVTEQDDKERQIIQAVVRFCIIGESRQSFAYRAMKSNLDRPTWDLLTEHLAGAKVLLIGTGTRPTWFMDGWNSVKVRVALKRGELKPPTGLDGVPRVVWTDYRRAKHTR